MQILKLHRHLHVHRRPALTRLGPAPRQYPQPTRRRAHHARRPRQHRALIQPPPGHHLAPRRHQPEPVLLLHTDQTHPTARQCQLIDRDSDGPEPAAPPGRPLRIQHGRRPTLVVLDQLRDQRVLVFHRPHAQLEPLLIPIHNRTLKIGLLPGSGRVGLAHRSLARAADRSDRCQRDRCETDHQSALGSHRFTLSISLRTIA